MTTPQDERRNATSASSALPDSLCPGRHLAQRGLPDERTADADFGQQIHDALADETKAVGLTTEQLSIYEMCKDAEAKLVLQFFGLDADKVKWFREQRYWCLVPLADDTTLEHSGKPDVVYRHGARGLVLEYKSLPGDVPEPSSNLQLRDQAVLAGGSLILNEIGAAVIQPLVTMSPSICLHDAAALKQAEMEMFERVRKSNDPASPRIPGPVQCQWCRAKGVCKEYAAWAAALVPSVPVSLAVPVADWTPEMRAVFCEGRSSARKWLDDCEAQMKELLKADEQAVPGWMLEPGDIRKSVSDPQTLFNRFSEKGGTLEQFMACVGVTKKNLEEQVRAVTKAKGKGLKKEMDALLEGIVKEKQNAPSLARRKE